MELKRGQVVRSTAGHDKGDFLTVLALSPPGASPQWADVCDGKRRPLASPKRKNLLHLAHTGAVLPEEALKTDRQIRAALRPFKDRAGKA